MARQRALGNLMSGGEHYRQTRFTDPETARRRVIPDKQHAM